MGCTHVQPGGAPAPGIALWRTGNCYTRASRGSVRPCLPESTRWPGRGRGGMGAVVAWEHSRGSRGSPRCHFQGDHLHPGEESRAVLTTSWQGHQLPPQGPVVPSCSGLTEVFSSLGTRYCLCSHQTLPEDSPLPHTHPLTHQPGVARWPSRSRGSSETLRRGGVTAKSQTVWLGHRVPPG